MTRRTQLSVDAGQTAVKVSLDDRPVRIFPGIRADASVLPQLADIIGEVAADADYGELDVAVGSAAFTGSDTTAAASLLARCASARVARLWLTPDSVTSFLGALGDIRGVVVAVGTGAVTLGVGEHRVTRVDGWGNVMGDAGSGYWIGREALDAVMRQHDGRGPATQLTLVVKRLFPVLDDAYMELLPNPDRVRLVASLAREVGELARHDRIAAQICKRAGRELAHSVTTAIHAIGQGERSDPVVCLIGGVVESGPVRESCIAELRNQWPALMLLPARGDALSGTRTLPSLPAGHPLSSKVQIASSAGTNEDS